VIAFNHFPFTSKDIINTFILGLISYQHLELIIFFELDNIFQKGKELNKGFSLFNFPLMEKGFLSLLLSN
jgi:hypothetical protein